MRNLVPTVILTLLVSLGLAAPPVGAGDMMVDCCICQNCASGPAVQCTMAATTMCNLTCMDRMCTLLEVESNTPCAEVAACPMPPAAAAAAPALSPGGLSLAASVLAGFGVVALRRVRRMRA